MTEHTRASEGPSTSWIRDHPETLGGAEALRYEDHLAEVREAKADDERKARYAKGQ
jgi:hypothetical protein